MNCPIETQENAETLLAYCAGKLEPGAEVILETHIKACPQCRAFCEGQGTLWKALDVWEAPAVSADFDRRLYGRIEAEGSLSWWDRLVRPLRPMLIRPVLLRPTFAVAAACVIVTAGFLLESPNRVGTVSPQGPAAEVIEVEQVERALDDLEMLREFSLVSMPETTAVKSM